jgi:hypothetical protein
VLKRVLFILIILLGAKAAADSSAPVKAYVWTTANPEKMKKVPVFRGPNYEVLSPTRGNDVEEGYITPHEREAIFNRTGIAKFVGGMDDLDKDLLVEQAGELPAAKLHEFHPKIPLVPLSKLIEEVKAYK